jgi:hypothetical protein
MSLRKPDAPSSTRTTMDVRRCRPARISACFSLAILTNDLSSGEFTCRLADLGNGIRIPGAQFTNVNLNNADLRLAEPETVRVLDTVLLR